MLFVSCHPEARRGICIFFELASLEFIRENPPNPRHPRGKALKVLETAREGKT
jgi:hypothetical protein